MFKKKDKSTISSDVDEVIDLDEIDDFRSGKMGNITLETPEQANGQEKG